MRLALRVTTLLLIAVIALSHTGQSALRSSVQTTGKRASFSIPFRLVDNRIFVDVKLNGKGPFSFILDTGGYGGISAEAAQAAGLKLGAEVQGSGAGEKVVTARETSVERFELGELEIKNQDLRVFDFSDVRHVFGSAKFDGIIGLPVFQRLVVKVDYAKELLTFTEPTGFAYKGSGVVVPFEHERYLPIVQGEVDGVRGRFGVDTGDRSTLTLKGPFVDEYKLREKYAPRVEALTGWGLGGAIRAEVVRTGALKFGGVLIKEPVTRLSLQRSGAFAANDTAGNIGAGVLKQFTVIFDYSRKQMILEKNKNFGRRDVYDRAGMWISQSSDGKSFEVMDVVAGSPAAAAGLKVGDRILALDDKALPQLDLFAARLLLKSAAGKRLRVQVQSGNERREITLMLKDLI